MEAGRPAKAARGIEYYCRICCVESKKTTEHCDDCGVCIEEYDHHCVFFSKCIGGGNLLYFWGSMAMVAVNFIVIIIALVCYGSVSAGRRVPH